MFCGIDDYGWKNDLADVGGGEGRARAEASVVSIKKLLVLTSLVDAAAFFAEFVA